MLNDSGAKVLIVGTELKPTIDKIRDELHQRRAHHRGHPRGRRRRRVRSACWPRRPPSDRGDDVEPDDVCIIMYSSGTTGRPKGVAADPGQPDRAHGQRARGLGIRRGRQEHGRRCRCSTSAARPTSSSASTTACPSVMTRDVDGASLAGAILQGRQPDLPGARGARQGAGVRSGRGQAVRRAEDLRVRRVADAACRCCARRWRRGRTPTSSRRTG